MERPTESGRTGIDAEQGHNTGLNENLDESSVEEGNEDLKAKIPELTSKKFIRNSGTAKDQLWLVPYKDDMPV